MGLAEVSGVWVVVAWFAGGMVGLFTAAIMCAAKHNDEPMDPIERRRSAEEEARRRWR